MFQEISDEAMTPRRFEQWGYGLIRDIGEYNIEAQNHDSREVPAEMIEAVNLLMNLIGERA